MKDYKQIYVEWVDSTHTQGWRLLEEARAVASASKCRTMGFLIHEDDKQVLIAQSTGMDEDTSHTVDAIMAIPKSVITKRKYL